MAKNDDWEQPINNLINDARFFRDLKYENSILKAVLKYKKPCITCSEEMASKLSKIATNLGLNFKIINMKDSYKFVVWKND